MTEISITSAVTIGCTALLTATASWAVNRLLGSIPTASDLAELRASIEHLSETMHMLSDRVEDLQRELYQTRTELPDVKARLVRLEAPR